MKDKKLTGSIDSMGLQRKMMPGQPDSISWRGDWLSGAGTAVDAIYPDFSKAFNTVSYNIFILKTLYGLSGQWGVLKTSLTAGLRVWS